MSKKMWKKLYYTFAYGCYGVDYLSVRQQP